MNKETILFLFLLSFFSFKNELHSQTTENSKIHLKISNIPDIEHKVSTGKNSYKIDKSATIKYRLFDNYIDYPIQYDSINYTLTKDFYEDTIYLKLRYNPGRNKLFILRKGDSANIDYIFGIPYLNVKNRKFKKNDQAISKAIHEFKFKDERFHFFNPFYKVNKEREKQKSLKAYQKIINSLDSLAKEELISTVEHNYYKKYFKYRTGFKSNTYNLHYLKRSDLHIEGFELYLRQYVFKNLKKKTISLGNGLARNSLEAFDFVFASKDFSERNKHYLLSNSLINIKLDFPKSTYNNRLQQFNSLYTKNILKPDNESKFLKSIYKKTANVSLEDSKNNHKTLQEVINNNKGKVIYIDFWASWCAPCRQAFPAYEALKKDYKNKEIIFVFISGDDDVYKWQKAETKEKLTHSYIALNFAQVDFYDDLNIKRFPRYLIFDKSGQLLIKNAPGPDSDNIRLFLNEALKY